MILEFHVELTFCVNLQSARCMDHIRVMSDICLQYKIIRYKIQATLILSFASRFSTVLGF